MGNYITVLPSIAPWVAIGIYVTSVFKVFPFFLGLRFLCCDLSAFLSMVQVFSVLRFPGVIRTRKRARQKSPRETQWYFRRILARLKCPGRSYYRSVHRSFPIRLRNQRFFPDLGDYKKRYADSLYADLRKQFGPRRDIFKVIEEHYYPYTDPFMSRSEGEQRCRYFVGNSSIPRSRPPRRPPTRWIRTFDHRMRLVRTDSLQFFPSSSASLPLMTVRGIDFDFAHDVDFSTAFLSAELEESMASEVHRHFGPRSFTRAVSPIEDEFNFLTNLEEPGVEVVYDSGASGHLLNDPRLFDSPPETIFGPLLHGISGSVRVEGEGLFTCKALGSNGKWSIYRGHAYYAPSCSRSLISTQTLLRDAENVHAGTPWLEDVYARGERPTVESTSDRLILKHLHPYQPHIEVPLDVRSNLFLGVVYPIDFQVDMVPDSFSKQPRKDDDDEPFEALITAVDQRNLNLSEHQKTLLQWHQILGHVHMDVVQRLLANRTISKSKSKQNADKKAATVTKCGCLACNYGKQKQTSKEGKKVVVDPDKVMATKREQLMPGDRVFVDHFHCDKEGRSESGTGVGGNKYIGGSIWVDAATGCVRVHLHTTFDTHETLLGKHAFEDWMAEHGVNRIKEYVFDGHKSFTSQGFQEDLAQNRQVQRIAAPGAHHHNGPAERAIGVLMNMTRTMMIHATLHWPDMIESTLWPLAVLHAVHIMNRVPRRDTANRSSIELLTNSILDPQEYSDLHVWGSPVYVLDPGISKGGKIPKWKPRSRRGVYMGVSEKYASSVPNVLNPHSGHITSQFHCLFDDWFFTVESDADAIPDFTQYPWDKMFECRLEWQSLDDADNTLDFELSPEWTEEWQERKRTSGTLPISSNRVGKSGESFRRKVSFDIPQQREPDPPSLVQRESVPDPSHQRENESDLLPEPPPSQDAAGSSASSPYAIDVATFRNPPPPDFVDDLADIPFEDLPDPWAVPESPAPLTLPDEPDSPPITIPDADPAPPVTVEEETPPVLRRSTRSNFGKPASKFADEYGFAGLGRWQLQHIARFAIHEMLHMDGRVAHESEAMRLYLSAIELLSSSSSPSVKKKKKKNSDPDTLSYWEVLKAADRDEFIKGMESEFVELWNAGTFTIVHKDEAHGIGAQIVPSTWTFRRKRNQFTGEVKRYKARLCLRGDLEKHVSDTYAPVGTWSTVRMMLTLAARFKYVTRCFDVSNAFVQAKLKEVKFMSLPIGSEKIPSLMAKIPDGASLSDYCLKVHRSIYGASDAPRLYYKHCHEIFTNTLKLKQCSKDSCLYFGDGIAVSLYVDDKFVIADDQKKIDKLLEELKKVGLPVTDEGPIAQYLGIQITRKDDSFHLTQTPLIDKIIAAVGFSPDRVSKEPNRKVPAKAGEALGSDPDGDPFTENWDYRSVIGMLLFISNNTRPDITMAVSQAARYSASPKKSHGVAVKKIVRYLQVTRENGLTLKPGNHVAIDAYVDSDFAGTWGSERPTDPKSVKSRAGFVICFGGCPVTWKSQLIVETCLSTMMAEYISLSMCARQLIPMRIVARELCECFKLKSEVEVRTHSVIFEDNNGALTLANAPEDTPQSKFYAVKYHWFREHVKNGDLLVKKIESKNNFADLFTKVDTATFFDLRKRFMGF